jgi:hypothetical protein
MIGKTLLYKTGIANGRRFKRGDLREALYQVCLKEGKLVLWKWTNSILADERI